MKEFIDRVNCITHLPLTLNLLFFSLIIPLKILLVSIPNVEVETCTILRLSKKLTQQHSDA